MTYCTDSCCRPEYEGPVVVVLSETTPVARKEHVCASCGHPIPPGTRYHRTVAIVDGDLDVEKSHRDRWAYDCVLDCRECTEGEARKIDEMVRQKLV